ncbi:MAG TPA: DUF885 family protein, partial [Thermoanaerobaculia bacterium]|nr:DUF885 family protein [Thermoanaerobaculia bacterium]
MLSRSALLMLVPFLLLGAAPARRPAKAPSAAAKSAAVSKELAKFFDDEWELGLRENPERATYLGDPRYNDRLTDLSFEAIERRNKHEQEALARLKKIDRTLLSEDDRLSYDLYQRRLEV